MSERYEHLPIERKWQKIWDDTHCFEAKDDFTKPKYYALIEFPFPSGAGLHVGHPRSNTALDIISRKRRMEGYNVHFITHHARKKHQLICTPLIQHLSGWQLVGQRMVEHYAPGYLKARQCLHFLHHSPSRNCCHIGSEAPAHQAQRTSQFALVNHCSAVIGNTALWLSNAFRAASMFLSSRL